MRPQLTALTGAICLLALSCQLLPTAESANIVIFLGVSSYSMRIPLWPIAEALSERGDNVTFVSPYPSRSKVSTTKINDYVPKKLQKWVESWPELGFLTNVFEDRKKGTEYLNALLIPELGTQLCEVIYSDEDYLNWVKSSKVDLLILDSLANECGYGMAHYWGAKVVVFHSTAPFGYFGESFGFPDETASIPSPELHFGADLNFFQRMAQAVLPPVWYYFRRWNYFTRLEDITKDKLGIKELPTMDAMEKNTSLVFLNTHYGEEFPRALPPNVVPIGGIAVTGKKKALPKDLEEFLNKGNGFIYLSFGTFVDFLQMDKAMQQVFIGAMRNLSHIQFVWKVGDESYLKEFPSNNVFIGKWMPQQDILAHPKIKAFITHAGLMSIQEAVHYAVPLISFPVFAEQDYNAERIHRKENGIRLEVNTVTQAELEDAINRIISEPKYRNNMKRTSMLFNERPQKPLETALWWTDFVLRHSQEELAALRPLSLQQTWWQRRQLDVWATIFVFVGALLVTLSYVTYKLLRCICCSKSSSARAKIIEKSHKKKVQ